MNLCPPDALETLRRFETMMVERLPSLRGKEPTYFARSDAPNEVYRWPEAQLALVAFMAGADWGIAAVKAEIEKNLGRTF